MLGFKRQQVATDQRGTRREVQGAASAVIVGGGIGGLAAATIFAERGVAVTVIERERFLGGRAGAWTDHLPDGEPFELDRGMHAFFRQYYNLRNLIRRVDPGLRNLVTLDDYPVFGAEGRPESYEHIPRKPPFNLVALLHKTPRFRWSDFLKINGPVALEMLAYDAERTWRELDERTARDYLDSLRFPEAARRLMFDVFAHSFFNPENRMSAAEMIAMFHFYFTGNPEGLVFDLLSEPLSTGLWVPMRRYLEGLGVRFLLGRPVETLSRKQDGTFEARIEGEPEPVCGDVAVLAVTIPGLKALVTASEALAPLKPLVGHVEVTAPFAVWRLWHDQPPRSDRPPFLAASGLGELDLLCFRELFEGEARRWAMRTGGSSVELHAYAAPSDIDEGALRRDLMAQYLKLFPEARAANIIEERYLWRQDCPAFPPGGWARRPAVQTPVAGLALAGDFVKMPFPCALMERAAASGITAANMLMQRWELEPEPLWAVPDRGFMADLAAWRSRRRAARRARAATAS